MEEKFDENAILTDEVQEELLKEIQLKMESKIQRTDLDISERWRDFILTLFEKLPSKVFLLIMGIILSWKNLRLIYMKNVRILQI